MIGVLEEQLELADSHALTAHMGTGAETRRRTARRNKRTQAVSVAPGKARNKQDEHMDDVAAEVEAEVADSRQPVVDRNAQDEQVEVVEG